MTTWSTLEEKFRGCFERIYRGNQDDRAARYEFGLLTNNHILWTQVHGDFKDLAKRLKFEPYPHWTKLHECCGHAIREAIKMDPKGLYCDSACAKIMDAAMVHLRTKYSLNAPRWWIPLKRKLQGISPSGQNHAKRPDGPEKAEQVLPLPDGELF
jgi:hypothetical protein